MNKPLKIVTTNLCADGCYTATLYFGSEKTPINVFLDTGSSTLAINADRYDGKADKSLKPTRLAQYVTYLDGSGWKGPVVRMQVGAKHFRQERLLRNVTVAVSNEHKDMFTDDMQGILGLAYAELDEASKYPEPTWPRYDASIIDQQPIVTQKPYFTQLEEAGTTPNKFAMYTLRSAIHCGQKPNASNPWNRGYLILGGGEEYRSLYEGRFKTIKVVHDLYYNTNLTSVRVGRSQPMRVPPSAPGGDLNSNAIVDNGTSTLCFPTWLYKKVIKQFRDLNPDFAKTIRRSIRYDDVKLSESAIRRWPSIHLTMEGVSGNVNLSVRPENYWQAHYTDDGVTGFYIDHEEDDQTILGLPFMNNYYCVFDRSANEGLGVIRLARPKLPTVPG